MNRILVVVLLCPLTAAAADWRYDGQAAAGASNDEVTTARTSESHMTVSAAPPPAGAPRGSMNMIEVQAAQGEPLDALAPVGDPPITRWQYPGYVVYFEHDRVITSVAGHW